MNQTEISGGEGRHSQRVSNWGGRPVGERWRPVRAVDFDVWVTAVIIFLESEFGKVADNSHSTENTNKE
ncbi:MAG: hypothetical protein H6657_31165 [Ardenticatenaceae bacterium]|nr:hypothetical protein [Ardenticatenaceae bacterium]